MRSHKSLVRERANARTIRRTRGALAAGLRPRRTNGSISIVRASISTSDYNEIKLLPNVWDFKARSTHAGTGTHAHASALFRVRERSVWLRACMVIDGRRGG